MTRTHLIPPGLRLLSDRWRDHLLATGTIGIALYAVGVFVPL